MTHISARKAGRDRSSVTVIRSSDGKLGWRALDDDGKAVRPGFGKIYGVEDDAHANSVAYGRSIKIIERVLREMERTSKATSIGIVPGKIRIAHGKKTGVSTGHTLRHAAASKAKSLVKRKARKPAGPGPRTDSGAAIED